MYQTIIPDYYIRIGVKEGKVVEIDWKESIPFGILKKEEISTILDKAFKFHNLKDKSMKNVKCHNTDCSGFSSEHKWNCASNSSEEEIKNCFNFTPEKETINNICMTPLCARKDCIYIFELDGSCNFINGPEYDSKGCIFYKKKEYRCNTTICIHYSMEINDCDFVSIPKKINGVCSRYEPEPVKESTCPHCGKSLESETSLEIARVLYKEMGRDIEMTNFLRERINKMVENYEDAISDLFIKIDVSEDEQRRIVRLLIDLDTPADMSSSKWLEIKNIIIPIIQGEIK